MTLRRYTEMKPSRGTLWPPEVRAEITVLDGGRCVCRRAKFPEEVIARCGGQIELDHVRAGGTGMKSESTVENRVSLSSWCHRWKTEHGREARPLLLDRIPRRTPDCSHVDRNPSCGVRTRRSLHPVM